MLRARVATIALAAVLLAGCKESPAEPKEQFESPGSIGAIAQVDGDEFLLAHNEDECGRTRFGRYGETTVLRKTQAGELEPSSWDELARNQVVEVWSGTLMLTSCPGQTGATKVVIQPPGPNGEIDRPVHEGTGMNSDEHGVIYVLEGERGRVFGRLEGSCPDGSPRTRWTIPEDGADAEVWVNGRGVSNERQVLPGEALAGGRGSGAENWWVTVGVQPEEYRLDATLEAGGGDVCLFELVGRVTGTSRYSVNRR